MRLSKIITVTLVALICTFTFAQELTKTQRHGACSGYHQFWAALSSYAGRIRDERFSQNIVLHLDSSFPKNQEYEAAKIIALRNLTRAFQERDYNLIKSFAGFCHELNIPIGQNTKQ